MDGLMYWSHLSSITSPSPSISCSPLSPDDDDDDGQLLPLRSTPHWLIPGISSGVVSYRTSSSGHRSICLIQA